MTGADNNNSRSDRCYHCGAVLDGAEVCPQCGRKQYRVCFCGERIPVNARVCPHCGADWSHSRRVRRKSRQQKLSYQQLARFAGLGALVAVVAAGLLHLIITGLAQRSLSPEQTLPASLLERMGLALHTIQQNLAKLGEGIMQWGGSVAVIAAVALVGAGVGVVIYLMRTGVISVPLYDSDHGYKRKRRTK